MAILNIRNLPDDVHAMLRVLAAQHGKSMEAEAREILTLACRNDVNSVPASSLQELVTQLYGDNTPNKVVDQLINERRVEAGKE